ncbi:hypothetical protein BGW36DRAFT_291319 [Talaromyces proteolyticus]|uniref:Zn(2)-C6 fungal-type domain-containing protein n=1 Tax=Talaromyces proteolyticus TaxID=1131652 RepID=A0AAD4KT51_9EURO|nr:uncharacterized protein BGW36DRAFT_291319 [Talaromyces proteolyticus]KAH8700423.1 hypothetical protein BGW36DRAFT_291319 [Talaromyces proteolyticus]
MSTHQAYSGPSEPQPAPSQQLNRSCESCRALKVRCLPDIDSPNQCQRCVKAKRACIFVAPQRRRPRKRTDSRVAQLEKEMAAMRSMLKDQRKPKEDTINEEPSPDPEDAEDIDFGTIPAEKLAPPNYQEIQFDHHAQLRHSHSQSQSPGARSAYDLSRDGNSSQSTPSLTQNASSPDFGDGGDIVDRGFISISTAEELVSLFMNDLLDYFPFIVLPADTTTSQLRHSKPILFLAIVAASSIAVDASLSSTLNHEMINLYAQRFFFKGEKSLEMVQALVLMHLYYLPPESPTQIQAYQYPHIAATMALEIGIASKKRMPRRTAGLRRQAKPVEKFDEQMAEQARTILICYHLASTVAMRTRRPNMLQYNDWIKECVRMLSRSPIDSDKRLAMWFELQTITDEALSSFGLDDTSSTAPLTETRVNAVLRLFDKKMDDWKENLDPEDLTVPMVLEYQHNILTIYELGIGEGYREPDAIKQQYYTLPAPDSDNTSHRSTEPLSAIRIDLNIKWLNAAQGMLDSFLNCDVHTMRKMPNLTYSRVVLGVMVLLKIYFSIKSSSLGYVITPNTVNVESYLESMTQRLTEASAGSKYPIPSRWLRVVGGKARDWLRRFQAHHKENQEAQSQLGGTGTTDDSAPLAVGPSSSTMTAAWHGGIVPMPTKIVPSGMHPSYPTDEYTNQSNLAAYHTTTTGPPTHPTSTPTHWLPSDPTMHHHHLHQPLNTTPTATAYAQLSSQPQPQPQSQSQSQPVWSFHTDMPSVHAHHPSYPLDYSDGNMQYHLDNNLPIEMEFDWVPDKGMFQLPTF